MDLLDAHRRAQTAFAEVLARVGDDELEAPTPCADWSVRQLVEHVVAGNSRLAGLEDGAAVGAAAPQLAEAHRRSAEAAVATFAEPEAMTRHFEIRIGSVPGSVLVGMRATDVFVHAWDLARASGLATDLDPELAGELLELSRQRVKPEFRRPGGPFGPERPCSQDRPVADRLAAFLGRDVD